MNRRWVMPLAALAATILFVALGTRSTRHVPPAPVAPVSEAAPAVSVRAEIGFRTRERLVEHHRRHGGDFGNVTVEEYLRLAQTLRDRRAGGDVLEAVRGDGVVTRFDRASGAFLAYDSDGTIRTFFKPNDGQAYFRRQLARAHGRS